MSTPFNTIRLRHLQFLVAVVIMFPCAKTTIAATYYLDAANGLDTNPGTSAEPWKTLTRAYTWYAGDGPKVQEGDTVLLRTGSYGDFIENSNNGSAYLFYRKDWVTYKAATGHQPVLGQISILNRDKWPPIQHGSSYLVFEGITIADGIILLYTSHIKFLDCDISVRPNAVEGYYAPYYNPNVSAVSGSYTSHVAIRGSQVHNAYRGVNITDGYGDWDIEENQITYVSADCIAIGAGICNLNIIGNELADIRRYTTTIDIYGAKIGEFSEGETVVMPGTGASGIVHDWKNNHLRVYATSERTFYECWWENKSRSIVGASSKATMNPITDVDPQHTDALQVDVGSGAAKNFIIRSNIIDRQRYVGLGTEDGQGVKLWGRLNSDFSDVTLDNNFIDAHQSAIIHGVKNVSMYNNTIYGKGGFELGAMTLYSDTIFENMYNNIIERFNIIDLKEGDYYVRVVNHGNNIFGNNPNGAGRVYKFTTDPHTETVSYPLSSDMSIAYSSRSYKLFIGSPAIDAGTSVAAPSDDLTGRPRANRPDIGCYEYTGLRGHWLVDEYSSDRIPNLAGQSQPAIVNNGNKWFAKGQPILNGVSDSINCDSGSSLNVTADLTIAAWISPEGFGAAGDARIVDKGVRPAGFAFYLKNDGRLAYRAGTAEVASAVAAVQVNEWQHVAVAYSDNTDTVTFYVNGQPAGVVPNYQTNPTDSAAAPLIIGNTAALDRGFKGTLSDVRIYSRALDDDEIKAIYETWEVKENKPVRFDVSATDSDGNPLEFVIQTPAVAPAGAVCQGNVFNWRPWYNQSGSYDIIFEAVNNPGYTHTVPIAVDNVPIADWYRTFLMNDQVLRY